jgi:hypothetical protein
MVAAGLFQRRGTAGILGDEGAPPSSADPVRKAPGVRGVAAGPGRRERPEFRSVVRQHILAAQFHAPYQVVWYGLVL